MLGNGGTPKSSDSGTRSPSGPFNMPFIGHGAFEALLLAGSLGNDPDAVPLL